MNKLYESGITLPEKNCCNPLELLIYVNGDDIQIFGVRWHHLPNQSNSLEKSTHITSGTYIRMFYIEMTFGVNRVCESSTMVAVLLRWNI